jgi:pimeloyl-ACP methyl ester carboxylesterase
MRVLPLALIFLTSTVFGCASGPQKDTSPISMEIATQESGSRFDARLSGFEYPFRVEIMTFDTQGTTVEMAYMDVSAEQPNGQTVLLLHGKNFSGAYWESTARPLLKLGYRVVMPDQIGFGKSSKPLAYKYTLSEMATQTSALLTKLGVEKAHVVGHSMGGMVAARFAIDHTNQAQSLTLVNPIGLEDWQKVVPAATLDQLIAGEMKKTGEDVKNYMKNVYFDGKWQSKYDAVAELQVGWTTSPDRETLAKVGAMTSEMVFTQPVVQDFPKITTPTFLIIGTRDRTAIGRDRVTPEVRKTLGRYDQLGLKTRDAIPGAELVELEGIGHMPQVEAYDTYWTALSGFLARQ